MDDIVRDKLVDGVLSLPKASCPSSVSFIRDRVYFLGVPDGQEKQTLLYADIRNLSLPVKPAFDTTSIENSELSHEQKLLRERMRVTSSGVSNYFVSNNESRIAISLSDGLYVGRLNFSEPMMSLEKWASSSVACHWSPDDMFMGYVSSGIVYITDGIRTFSVTSNPVQGFTSGIADYLLQEEFDQYDGYWWSSNFEVCSNGDRIYQMLVLEVDSSSVKEVSVSTFALPPDNELETTPYSRAGEPNPSYSLAVLRITINEDSCSVHKTLIDYDFGGLYIPRCSWGPEKMFYVQTVDRLQQTLKLISFYPTVDSWKSSVLITEHSDVWVNVHSIFYVFPNGNFIWASERTGFRHLYLVNPLTGDSKQLTTGDWQVFEDKVIVAGDVVYFTGNPCTVESRLMTVNIVTNEIQSSIDHSGFSALDFTVSTDFSKVALTVSSIDSNPCVQIYLGSSLSGKLHPGISQVSLPKFRWEFMDVITDDGAILKSIFVTPFIGTAPYPLVVFCYGGPHVQLVRNTHRTLASPLVRILVNMGYAVAIVDNRGSFNRGIAFEGAIRESMGTVEVSDQALLVSTLVSKGLVVKERVGITGWSYGGYLSLMCLAKAGSVFKLAVSGAPVTSWELYDTAYTERYMNTPQNNPDGYSKGSVLQFANDFPSEDNRLLLVHGLIDENVHFTNTATLIAKLISLQKPYHLKIFPEERHGIRSKDSVLYFNRFLAKFLSQHL